jgi:ferritin-like metal-binding protein YciE
MSLKTLEDLFLHDIKDLYNAEQQLVKALPKMAKAASSEKLRQGFEEHLEQTRGHAERLETIFDQLGKTHRGAKCDAMKGLIEEGEKLIDQNAAPEVKDAGLIGAAQRVEHYEIAGYGTARTLARRLNRTEAEELLQLTLDEEKETDEKLTQLAESEVNEPAAHVGAS